MPSIRKNIEKIIPLDIHGINKEYSIRITDCSLYVDVTDDTLYQDIIHINQKDILKDIISKSKSKSIKYDCSGNLIY